MKLLVVESPAKANTIKTYLDNDFEVLASFGHFRDLPRSGIGIDEEKDFFVREWEIDKKKVDPLLKSIKKSDEIFLALDPDREGEMIAWHLVEICKEKKIFDGKQFKRIEFSAVRKDDILNAIKNPRDLNQNLVHAAITRRFLDRFFGYKISPITTRRTKFGKSAGRVQSPTLKMLCEREREIDLFQPKEFWDYNIELEDLKKNKLKCSIVSDNGKRFDKLSINNKEIAEKLRIKISNQEFFIENINKREKKRNPYSPFSNSLLLQDASSKLGFSPKQTNSIAQELKDGIGSLGALITYHRTDSNKMKSSEIKKLREFIQKNYGEKYVSKKEIFYKERSKFVQQGHEAVTPTNLTKKPDDIKKHLNETQYKLYDLIWKRTVASQMEASINLETTYYIKGDEILLKSSGSIEKFKGFKSVYNYQEKNEDEQKLPELSLKEKLHQSKLETKQNFTKPPNRYSEAGLVKKLEELGIGRPATYINIFKTLEDRKYVQIKNKTLIPTSSGKILSKFLDGFFNQFVDYAFTAELEEQLDQITLSKLEWKETLKQYLKILNKNIKEVEDKSMTEVIDKVNEYSPEILKEKKCPKCSKGKLSIKFAQNGPFIGCTEYKKDANGCNYSHAIGDSEDSRELSGEGKIIGAHPLTNKSIFLKVGRYGRYLETETKDGKIKRSGIPKNVPNEDLSLEKSVNFLTLPRTVGTHPQTKKEIIASIGPYGPYLKHDNKYISLKEDDVTEVGINRAVDLIDKKIEETKEDLIGIHPETKFKIIKKRGIKGRSDYLSHNKKNYPIPTELNEKKLTVSDAVKIINEKKNTKKKK